MSSIWDEKPVIEDGDYAETGFGDVTLSMPTGNYEVRLEAWLEKVKNLYEKTDKENCDLLYKMLTAQNKLDALKPILKHIEGLTNERPPRISLEHLHLNEQWFRVWDILNNSEFTTNSEEEG